MDTLRIETGEKRIAINDDPERVIVFNPNDIIFAEKFYLLVGEFENTLKDFQRKAEAIDAQKETDANGIPMNVSQRIQIQRELCEYIREKIDHLFGIGTSQKAFGDALSLDVFAQFFNGITPFIQSARSEKIAQYTTPAAAKRTKRK